MIHPRFLRLSIGLLFYSYQLVLRAAPGAMRSQLAEALNLSPQDMGWVFGCHFVTYTLFQGLMGHLVLHYGVRKLFLSSLLCCFLGLVMMAQASSLVLLTLGRLLIGAGGASAFLGTLSMARHDGFSATLTASWLVLCGKLTLLGSWPALTYLALTYNFSFVLNLLAAFGLLLVLTIYTTLHPPRPLKKSPSIGVVLHPSFPTQRFNLAIMMICGGLLSGSLLSFGETWGAAYVASVYNLSSTTASGWILFVFAGTLAGSALLPLAAKRFSGYSLLCWGSVAGWLFACGFILGVPQHSVWIALCLSGLGFSLSVQLLVFELAPPLMPQQPFEHVTSWVNVVLNSFNFLTPYLIGVLLNDTPWAYDHAFQLIVAYTSLAALGTLWLLASQPPRSSHNIR